MQLEFFKENDYTEITTLERIDATNAASFDSQINEFLDKNSDVTAFILNLSKVEYISSAGLRSILKLAKICSSKSMKLICCGIQPEVMDVLKISGFTALLTIKNDKEEAISAL